MEPISRDAFLSSAAERDIVADPVYLTDWPRNLAFLGGGSQRRYWGFRLETGRFFRCVLGALQWRRIDVWPKVEQWGDDLTAGFDAAEFSSLRHIARSIGAPLWTDGAVRFGRDDGDALLALLLGLASDGWSWTEDAYLIPDDDDVLLQLDHHGVLHAEFRSDQRLTEFVADLEKHGFPLPTQPPDSTFKPVPWMRPSDERGEPGLP